MTETDKNSQKPAASEQSNSSGRLSSEDFPRIPTILQHSADEGDRVYRGSGANGQCRE